MGRRKKSTTPLPSIHKQSGRSRVRIEGKTIWLGKAGSKIAAENYKQVLGVWGANAFWMGIEKANTAPWHTAKFPVYSITTSILFSPSAIVTSKPLVSN